ncbi:MAG: hypothetical protein ACFBZ8_10195 [Opitutales bacterium]
MNFQLHTRLLSALLAGTAALILGAGDAFALGPRVSSPAKRQSAIEKASEILNKDYDALWAQCENLPNPFVWQQEPEPVEPTKVVEKAPVPVAPPPPRVIPDKVILPLIGKKFQVKGVMGRGDRKILMTPSGKMTVGDVLRATVNGKTYVIMISKITDKEVILTLNQATFTKQIAPSLPSNYLTKD